MKSSHLLIPTLKETPKDAEVISHQLMLRAGFIRKVASGIYTYLPLGLKVIRKFEAIVREEMNRAGAQEVLMPMVIPSELWKTTKRWDKYGKELLRFEDRHGKPFCLGPTHEEVITDLVSQTVKSYKQLPINLYQIQTKFRDEIRPRFGLMRGREFIMKDSYSFHTSWDSLDKTYDDMRTAYEAIFSRCGLRFKRVAADAGAIGGDVSSEFMVTASTGEDAIIECTHCSFAANVEAAPTLANPSAKPAQKHLYLANGKPVAVVLGAGHEPNEIKIKKALDAQTLYTMSQGEASKHDIDTLPTYIDHSVEGGTVDLRNAVEGDTCPHCNTGTYAICRGIEVGHIFKLGKLYSEALSAVYLDESGQNVPMIMGCYGIGIGRTVAAAIEQNNDAAGIIWPMALAPFQVVVILTNTQDEDLKAEADTLYAALQNAGIDVLYDDRNESAGIKFKDADLIGIPLHVVVGKAFKESQAFEIKHRKTGERKTIPAASALALLQDEIQNHDR
ncbi:MAG: proline--tRNA ligase [Candidatus Margulisiibacteriota bacterium]